MSGVTSNLISNWLFIHYLKNDEISRSLIDGSKSHLFIGVDKIRSRGKEIRWSAWAGDWSKSSRDPQTAYDSEKAPDPIFPIAGATKGANPTFIYQLIPNFAYRTIGRQAMLASSTNSGTFFKDLEMKVQEAVDKMHEDIVAKMYGTHGPLGVTIAGQIGRVDTVTAAGTYDQEIEIELESSNLQMFSSGGEYEFAAAAYNGTTDLRKAHTVSTVTRNSFQIAALDKAAGEFTFVNTRGGTGTSPEVGDYIWRKGDYLLSHGGSTGRPQPVGLANYIVPNSLSDFLGVNLNIDPIRLYGFQQTLNSRSGSSAGEKIHDTISAAIRKMSARHRKYKNTEIYAHPSVFLDLVTDRRLYKSSVNIMNMQEKKFYGMPHEMDALLVMTPQGTIPMFFDVGCPPTRVFGSFKKALKLAYLSEDAGKIVSFKKQNENRVFVARDGTNDNMFQLESYTALANYLPGCFWYFDTE